MRNPKRRGKHNKPGAEGVLESVDLAAGGEKSRAAARMLAEQFRQGDGRTVESGAEGVQSQGALADAMCDPNQAWSLVIETIGGDEPVERTVFAPAWMNVEDVRRFLYGDD
jgi:hypothetical protein